MVSAPWRKALRDSWHERTRTVLVVSAIALGVAATQAVLSAYAILTRELDRGYLATRPAAAILWTDAVDDALLRDVAAQPGVGDAEGRRVVSGRIKAGTGGWRALTLFVVRDFAGVRVSTLDPERGAWPPGPGEILIERDALQVAGAHIGDTVTVRTAHGDAHALRVSGTVHDVGQAQARMERVVYGYVTLETLGRLGETATLDRVLLRVADRPLDEAHVGDVAARVQAFLESRGHPVTRTEVPRPGKHPHSDLMGMLLLAMASFGLFVLLLSGIIVVNLLTARMAAQARHIAVMKAIGGSRTQVAAIYFRQALLLGVAAFLAALPAGILGGRALCRYMAVFLNFDIHSFAVPAWVYLLAAGVAIVAPLLAAGFPVWTGSGRSVREGLADHGVPRDAFGASGLDRAVAGFGGFSRPLLLALRSSFRRRMRLALTLLTLGAGGVFFMSALNLRASMIHTLDHLFAGKKFDLGVNLGTMYPYEQVERAVRNTPGIARAEGWIVSEGTLTGAGDPPAAPAHRGPMGGVHGTALPSGEHFTVVAVPSATQLLRLEITDGRDLHAGETDGLVVNSALLAKQPQMTVGALVSFRLGPAATTWHVVGIARESFSSPTAYIAREFYDKWHPGTVNSLRIALAKNDPASMEAVEAALETNLEHAGVRAQGMRSQAESRRAFDEHMEMIYVFLVVMSAILAGVGGLGLMTTMSLGVLERRREIGVMRAIGASSGTIAGILVAEGALVGLASWALAAVTAWPVSWALGKLLVHALFKTRLDFDLQPLGILAWLLVCLGLGALASAVPAWHASRGPVREALSYE